jgi:hypothetical protein
MRAVLGDEGAESQGEKEGIAKNEKYKKNSRRATAQQNKKKQQMRNFLCEL